MATMLWHDWYVTNQLTRFHLEDAVDLSNQTAAVQRQAQILWLAEAVRTPPP